MIKLFYNVNIEDKDSEIEWLKDQKVFPAIREHWQLEKAEFKKVIQIGMIVSPEAALAIKLRRTLRYQEQYNQK